MCGAGKKLELVHNTAKGDGFYDFSIYLGLWFQKIWWKHYDQKFYKIVPELCFGDPGVLDSGVPS